MNYWFHLIAGIDDMTQVQIENLQKHQQLCLKTRLNQSKNVTDECNAPWQAIVGCLDTTFCILLSTSQWLELNAHTQLYSYLFGFSTDNIIPNGGLKSKNMVRRVYWLLFKDRKDLFSFEKSPLELIEKCSKGLVPHAYHALIWCFRFKLVCG